jgi:hypothetical protein
MKRSSFPIVPVAAFAALCIALSGCETNRPQEMPEIAEVSAASIATQSTGSLDGWWVKVCPKMTEASGFKISVGPDEHDITQRIVWRQGDPLEFQLLGGRDYNQIFVAAYSGQDGKNAFFGVCHDAQVCARRYNVNQTEQSGGEGHTIKNSDTDDWNCD